jgi:hypothetical protein
MEPSLLFIKLNAQHAKLQVLDHFQHLHEAIPLGIGKTKAANYIREWYGIYPRNGWYYSATGKSILLLQSWEYWMFSSHFLISSWFLDIQGIYPSGNLCKHHQGDIKGTKDKAGIIDLYVSDATMQMVNFAHGICTVMVQRQPSGKAIGNCPTCFKKLGRHCTVVLLAVREELGLFTILRSMTGWCWKSSHMEQDGSSKADGLCGMKTISKTKKNPGHF